MANYELIAGSKFQPFSFERYIQPYQIYGQAFREVENAMGEMEQRASIWDQMANEQTDPEAYKMYKNYADDLRDQTDYLIKYGLNANSRRGMMNLKSRYNKEIVPIENAYRRREELAKEQRDALNANPSMFYQRDMTTTSLDDFIRNPSLDYGKKYSGALLAQQVGQMAASLKSQLTGRSKMKGIGLPYQYEQLIQYGYTPEQIWQAINNPKEGNPILNTIVEQALDASGMKEWASPAQLAQARAYANEGLYNAIGKTDIKNFTDSYSAQKNLQKPTGGAGGGTPKKQVRGVNPRSLYSSAEEDRHSLYRDKIREWEKAGYIRRLPDGTIVPTQKGFNQANTQHWDKAMSRTIYTWESPDLRNFLRDIGAEEDSSRTWAIGDKSLFYDNTKQEPYLTKFNLGKARALTAVLDRSGYDATRDTEFVHSYGSSTEQTRAKDIIRGALGNSGAMIWEYKNPKEGYISTNKTIDKKDFVNNYTVLGSKGSRYGQFFTVEDKKGNQYTIKVPEVHRGQQQAMQASYLAADDAYKNMLTLKPRYDSIVSRLHNMEDYNNLTGQDKQVLIDYQSYQQAYEDNLWDAENAQGNITRGYTTDNIETE